MTKSLKLSNDHIRTNFYLQLSGYYSGVDQGPGNAEYYFSELIPSMTWNHAVFADPTKTDDMLFVKNAALQRDRQPAFFVREKDINRIEQRLNEKASLARERWMICEPKSLNSEELPSGLTVSFSADASPGEAYFSVLENLFEDENVNDRFRSYYVPTLRRANLANDVSVYHATLFLDKQAVACGSIYQKGSMAGLYNVGTLASSQQKGFGRIISQALTEKAFTSGAREVFLQCVIGTHVEKLYEKIGFVSVETPGIFTFN